MFQDNVPLVAGWIIPGRRLKSPVVLHESGG